MGVQISTSHTLYLTIFNEAMSVCKICFFVQISKRFLRKSDSDSINVSA